MSALEYFIPQVLREIHAEWKHESLDAVFPETATKTAELEIEIIGTCIVISDQTMVPTYTWIRVSQHDDTIESMQCRLGELVGNRMKRVPYGGDSGCRIPCALRLDSVQWAYHVAFGLDGESRHS